MTKKLISFFLIMLLLSGCSLANNFFFSKKEDPNKINLPENKYETQDYLAQAEFYKNFYLTSAYTKEIKVSADNKNYVKKLIETIAYNNELFFEQKNDPEVYFINDPIPFHFSIPGKKIFLSSGLLKKYIKSEALLMCVLAYELIRSEKAIYRKRIIFPTGTLTRSEMLSFMNLGPKEKMEIHKWAFYVLKRVNVDIDTYLSWIQIQNRNSVDFQGQLGDTQSISREESLFKAFLIENKKKVVVNRSQFGSPKKFYDFINSI